MSIVAVRKKGKGFEIAGDSQSTWGGNKFSKTNLTDKQMKAYGKIFRVNGLTIGCAGSVADIGLLQMYCKTHKPKEMTRDCILDWFIEFKEWALAKAKVNFNDISVHGIIISSKKAFCFYDFMDVTPVLDFEAVGSGMFLAIGAMELGASAEQAVKVACKYDLYCGGKITKLAV